MKLFRLQKYKKFESNSQLISGYFAFAESCFDCKSTKNLRAIHNFGLVYKEPSAVVSTAKVQKIWEQFTTELKLYRIVSWLFRLQKYKKFESNSQPPKVSENHTLRCFDCKSTKNLRAIHNLPEYDSWATTLFRLQKYKKFESNSQRRRCHTHSQGSCFDCKSTKNLRAIHNFWGRKPSED